MATPHSDASPPAPLPASDPVLADLNQAFAHHQQVAAERERLAADLQAVQAQLAEARGATQRLDDQLRVTLGQLDQARRSADEQRRHAARLSDMLGDIRKAMFEGDVYSLILRVCLILTGATRGLYVLTRGPDAPLQIRAAVDVDGYPAAPPSPFLKALCARVLREEDTLVCNDPGEMADLPPPPRPSEQFRNCIVAPAVVLRNLNGIVIVADKRDGNFDEADVETLLSVGTQAAMAVDNERLQRALQQAYVSIVGVLADAAEIKDAETHDHCELVSHYACLIADALGLGAEERSLVCYAALLHDVGKIGVSDGLLNKPGALTSEERELIRSHVRLGHRLLSRVPAFQPVADIVLRHHEWYDGTGYPDGMRGEDIPLPARIVAVVDAYCAMITRRSYKEAYSEAHARQELRDFAGRQFDPVVVEAFQAILDRPDTHQRDQSPEAECDPLPGFTPARKP